MPVLLVLHNYAAVVYIIREIPVVPLFGRFLRRGYMAFPSVVTSLYLFPTILCGSLGGGRCDGHVRGVVEFLFALGPQ